MSNQKSFIGAYSRNRRATQKTATATRVEENRPTPNSNSVAKASQSTVPTPHLPAQDSFAHEKSSETVPPHPHLASFDQQASLDQQELIAQINAVDALIQQSVSVADTGALPEQHWIEQDAGEVLRVDSGHGNQLPIPEPAREPENPVVAELPLARTPEAPATLAPTSAGTDIHIETPSPEPPVIQPESAQPQWAGAAWEVDAFEIPHHVAELFFAEDFFRSIAEHMGRSVNDGLRSVLVTSTGAQNGRSTVAIGTAIAAAATGIRVALVDLDIDSAHLGSASAAEKLRLEVATDWVQVIRQGDSLENAAILSLEDGVTLLPLATNHTLPIASVEIDRLIELLSNCFDLILFDGPTVDCWATSQIATKVDASLIVRDTRITSQAQIETAAETLRHSGVQGIGVVDNFCS